VSLQITHEVFFSQPNSFLPLFCNCQCRRLDSIQFLCSQAHILAGWRLETQLISSESESYVTTDGQPASLSWNKAPIWGLRPDFNYCLTVVGLLIWSALSDERTGLSFQLLLAHASAVIFVSESLATRDRIILSQIRDFPFRRLLRLAGSRWRYSTPPPHGDNFFSTELFFMNILHGPRRKHSFQQPLLLCVYRSVA
jgi:hypothetical protein